MGVTGSGKTTVGKLLADELGWRFVDGDSFHLPANVEKMRRGVPLTDNDRRPWLAELRGQIQEWVAQQRNVVLACSALKKDYRQELETGPKVRFIYLKGTSELIGERLRVRHGHFAGTQILAGQFADLEEPTDAVTVDISATPDQIVAEARQKLGLA